MVIMAKESLEQRLFEAFKMYQKVTLDWDDVASLVRDDAVACRITNAAAIEENVDQPGEDMIGRHRKGETWGQFKNRVRDC